MKIKSIKKVGQKKVYDISVKDVEHYILENGAVTHNTGGYYSADNIWIVGRQQRKDGNEIEGYDYIINVEKSRFVKEKTKFPITVTFDGGIDKWSGMLELAVELGYIGKASKSTYQVIDRETGELIGKEYKKDELSNNDHFWNPMMTDSFKKALKEYCSL